MKKCAGFFIGLFAVSAWAQTAISVHTQSPDGRYLATAITTDSGSAIVMRDLNYERKSAGSALVIPVNKSPIISIVFSVDATQMSTTDSDGVQRVWQIERGGAATLLSTTPARCESALDPLFLALRSIDDDRKVRHTLRMDVSLFLNNLSSPLVLFFNYLIEPAHDFYFVAWVAGLTILVMVIWDGVRRSYRHYADELLWQHAMTKMNRVLLNDRENAALYWAKGELSEFHGDYKEALRFYRMAHQLSPKAYCYALWRDATRRVHSYLKGTDVPPPHNWRAYSHSI